MRPCGQATGPVCLTSKTLSEAKQDLAGTCRGIKASSNAVGCVRCGAPLASRPSDDDLGVYSLQVMYHVEWPVPTNV